VTRGSGKEWLHTHLDEVSNVTHMAPSSYTYLDRISVGDGEEDWRMVMGVDVWVWWWRTRSKCEQILCVPLNPMWPSVDALLPRRLPGIRKQLHTVLATLLKAAPQEHPNILVVIGEELKRWKN
jgi:hypothetical protein